MTDDRLLATGIGGTAITAVCCFTPVLVFVFGALGLTAWLGQLDAVLLPALAGFALLTAYALVRRFRSQAAARRDGP